MKSVKVNVTHLREVVRANRDSHRKIFEEAQAGYRKAAIGELDAMLAEARAGKRIRRSVELVEPVDQTREYDRVIKMLEICVDPEVELDERDVARYVQDDWEWKRQFLSANSTYSKLAFDTMEAQS